MKLTLSLLLFVSSYCVAHDSYYSFAELRYNKANHRLEASISLTIHDFEKALQKKGIIKKALEFYKDDSISLNRIYTEVLNHFKLSFDGDQSGFVMEGFELMKNGTVFFYASALFHGDQTQFDITFDLLMNEYPDQQNKLTFSYEGNKTTYLFTSKKRKESIEIQ